MVHKTRLTQRDIMGRILLLPFSFQKDLAYFISHRLMHISMPCITDLLWSLIYNGNYVDGTWKKREAPRDYSHLLIIKLGRIDSWLWIGLMNME